jgi:asparagine synthase (glutamine-hydrolysing)
MTVVGLDPGPGAVVVVRGPGERGEAALARARRGLRGERAAKLHSEGPLAVAVQPARELELHVSAATVCVLEGALYEIPLPVERRVADSPCGGPPASPAARLALAFEALGERALELVRGEFWALVWSRAQSHGIVLTDHIGSRAPYWTITPGALIVASEVRHLVGCLDSRPAPDQLTLAHWLTATGPRPGTTLFAGIHVLRAAHRLRISPGRCQEEAYWRPVYTEPLREPPQHQVQRLRGALELAVRRRRAGTGTTGVLLSGGLDSSAVGALAARHGPLHAYSVVFPDHPEMDESQLIVATVKRLGIQSTRMIVRGGSILAGALAYIERWGVPPTSPNLFFWSPLLERAAADGIEVVLDGEGGDELFAFSPYLVADRLRHGRLLSALALARRWPGESRPPSPEVIWLRLRLAGIKPLLPAGVHRLARRVRPLGSYAPGWLPPELARRWVASEDSAFAWKELTGPRWWAYIVELVTRGPGPSAVYEQARRRARAVGICARHPMVDIDVIELVLRLNPELAFDPRFDRALLREAISGLVPDEVRLRRRKSNFDALFHRILAGSELPVVRALLAPASCELRAFVDVDALHAELLERDPRSAGGSLARWAARVWRLVTAECWLRAQSDPVELERLRSRLAPPTAPAAFEASSPG